MSIHYLHCGWPWDQVSVINSEAPLLLRHLYEHLCTGPTIKSSNNHMSVFTRSGFTAVRTINLALAPSPASQEQSTPPTKHQPLYTFPSLFSLQC